MTARLPPAAWPVVVGIWVVAFLARLEHLPFATLGLDWFAPVGTASQLLDGHLPLPHEPHFGDLLWLAHVPETALSHSVEHLALARCLIAATIAPLGFVAAWILMDQGGLRRWAAAVAGGLVLALDEGLAHGTLRGDLVYYAPELVALATVGVAAALRGLPWGSVLLVVGGIAGVHNHPMAVAFFAGVLVLLPSLWTATPVRRRRVAGGLAVGLVLLQMARIWSFPECGPFRGNAGASWTSWRLGDLAQCLGGVSATSAREGTTWSLLLPPLQDRAVMEYGAVAWALAVGLAVGVRHPVGRLAVASLLALVGLMCLAHHSAVQQFRILAAPLAVAAATALASLPPTALGLLAASGLAGLAVAEKSAPEPRTQVQPYGSVLDDLGRCIAGLDGPVWLDVVAWDSGRCPTTLEVYLAARVRDSDVEQIQVDPTSSFVIVSCGPGPPARVLQRRENTSLLWFSDLASVRDWLDSAGQDPVLIGDAWDVLRLRGEVPHGVWRTRWWELEAFEYPVMDRRDRTVPNPCP